MYVCMYGYGYIMLYSYRYRYRYGQIPEPLVSVTFFATLRGHSGRRGRGPFERAPRSPAAPQPPKIKKAAGFA